MENRILVTSVGRAPALNFCRSLRLSNQDFYIVGMDTNKYSLSWAEADEKILVPKITNTEQYINLINYLIEKYNINFVYPSKTDSDLLVIARNRDLIKAKTFFPDQVDIDLFEDKWETYKLLNEKKICPLPETYLINSEIELYNLMEKMTNGFTIEIWLRRVYGSGGACSISTNDFYLARSWINRFDGWGQFTIAKKLTDKTLTWSGIWKDGNLIVSMVRERLYWEFADRAPSGVTGITGAQRLVKNEYINNLSNTIIRSVSKKPNGTISIDYTLDENGIPNLTEIQASRLYTSTHFMTKCGINFPFIFYKVAMGQEVSDTEKNAKLNENYLWLKYVGNYPILIEESELDEYENKCKSLQRLYGGIIQ